jgi:membrane protease subunit HflK
MDIDDWKNISTTRPNVPSAKHLGWIVLIVLVAILSVSSVYTVPPDSVAVVLRFGRYTREVQPGLRFKLPLGIEQKLIIPIQRQLKQEFGFATSGSTDPHQHTSSSNMDNEKRMVTGDLNSALVEWIIQYRISNPVDFLFKVRNPKETVRDVSESVMREVVGDRTVDEVLTIGRQEIEVEALLKMQKLISKYEVGVSIDQVQLKNVNPPRPVQESFNEVNQAQQEKEKLINEARREYNRSIPLAKGTKDQKIQEAEGYKLQRINEAQGDVSRFNAVLNEYVKAPEVTKRRIYLETMQTVLPTLKSKIIVDEDARSVLPLLQLNGQKGGRP